MPLNPDKYDPNKLPDGVYLCTIDKITTKLRDGSPMVTRDGLPQMSVSMKTQNGRFVRSYITVDEDGMNRLCRAASIPTAQLCDAEPSWFLDADYATGILLNRMVEVEVITRENKDPSKPSFTNVFVQKPGDAAERAAKKAAKAAGVAPPPTPKEMPFRPQPQAAPQGPPRPPVPPLQGTSRWSPPGPPKPMMQAPPRQRQPGEEGDYVPPQAGSGIGKEPPYDDVPFNVAPRQ